MIEIRYIPPHSLELSAMVEELRNIGREIVRPDTSLVIQANTKATAWPYERLLECPILQRGKGAIRVSVEQDKNLIVESSEENLDYFASWFDLATDVPRGVHSHFEYYDGCWFIAPDSVPLVIAAR